MKSSTGRRALITGIGGQDGSYLAELLLAEGYAVFGVVRGAGDFPNLAAIRDQIDLVEVDLLDRDSLVAAMRSCEPDEIYNLAAPSFVPISWRQPVLTAEFAAVGATSMLEAMRFAAPKARFYQASSSEIFGRAIESPQSERTPLSPVTPYGVAKAYAHFITASYRERYGIHASSGILFNHESPRRPLEFVTRKVSHAAASIRLGLQDTVTLGDLEATRDWGFAGDYVRAMWLMLQQDEPGDYVIATGNSHSVGELVELAFERVGLDWREHVLTDESLRRGKAELHRLVGDPAKARERLSWEAGVRFDELIHMLVDADLVALERGLGAKASGGRRVGN